MLTGQKIAQLRIQANLTQEQLAEKLFVTRQLVSLWETGNRQPGYNNILTLAEIFSVRPDDILNKNDLLLEELSDCLPEGYNESADTLTSSINAFLETLNERDRSVFIRRYLFMEDIAVIAEKYGIKENYARNVLMRTRKKFTKYFKEMYL